MRYQKILLKIMGENTSYSEIAKKCKEIGCPIDKSYISKLVNGNTKRPSEEISRAISKVCGKDERLLVIEGALDECPKEIFDAFNEIRIAFILGSRESLKNLYSKEDLDATIQASYDEPISEFIIGILDNDIKQYAIDSNNNLIVEDKKNNINITIEGQAGFEMKDDSMSPIISRFSKLQLKIKEKYEDGKILMFKIIESNETLCRYAFFKDDSIIFTASNKEYENKEYFKDEIKIIGQVVKVIKEI